MEISPEAERLHTEDNYLSNQNLDVAYYFPLRNEQNTDFLQTHIEYLEEKIRAKERRLERAEAAGDTFRNKYAILKRDIQIIQTRLIVIRKAYAGAENAEEKANKASHQASNIQTNVRLKNMIMQKMKAEYNEEYQSFCLKIDREEHKKVFTNFKP